MCSTDPDEWTEYFQEEKLRQILAEYGIDDDTIDEIVQKFFDDEYCDDDRENLDSGIQIESSGYVGVEKIGNDVYRVEIA